MPYYNRDPKSDHNFDSHPNGKLIRYQSLSYHKTQQCPLKPEFPKVIIPIDLNTRLKHIANLTTVPDPQASNYQGRREHIVVNGLLLSEKSSADGQNRF